MVKILVCFQSNQRRKYDKDNTSNDEHSLPKKEPRSDWPCNAINVGDGTTLSLKQPHWATLVYVSRIVSVTATARSLGGKFLETIGT